MSDAIFSYALKLRPNTNEIRRCPHCGTARPGMSLEAIVVKEMRTHNLCDGWAIYQCSTCMDIICFLGTFPCQDGLHSTRIAFANSNYYSLGSMPNLETGGLDDWPERAQVYMAQAIEALGTPDGAVMLAGSAIDAMLKHKGLLDGSVFSRIEKAVESNIITPEMGEWAHAVRISSNNPRHADLDSPHATPDEAKAVIEFAKALGQFLFVLPARIAEGKEKARQASEASDT